MAEVFHRYLRRGEPVPQKDADADALKAKKLAADLQFVEEKKLQRVFEKFYLGASRLSMRRMAARSMKASEVWTFNS